MSCPAKEKSLPPAQVIRIVQRNRPAELDKLVDILQAAVAKSHTDDFDDLVESMQNAVDVNMPRLLACCERSATRRDPFGRGNLSARSRQRVIHASFIALGSWTRCVRQNHTDQDPGPYGQPWCEWSDHMPSAQRTFRVGSCREDLTAHEVVKPCQEQPGGAHSLQTATRLRASMHNSQWTCAGSRTDLAQETVP